MKLSEQCFNVEKFTWRRCKIGRCATNFTLLVIASIYRGFASIFFLQQHTCELMESSNIQLVREHHLRAASAAKTNVFVASVQSQRTMSIELYQEPQWSIDIICHSTSTSHQVEKQSSCQIEAHPNSGANNLGSDSAEWLVQVWTTYLTPITSFLSFCSEPI